MTQKTKHSKQPPSKMRIEIYLLILLAACILLFLSNFGLGGAVGKAVSSLFFGLFGSPAFVFPVLLFFVCAILITNRASAQALRKGIGLAGLYAFTCAFFHLLMIGYDKEMRIIDCFTDSAYDHLGGGILGGALVKLFGLAFGEVGAVVLVVIGLIIFAIILTQKPLLSILRDKGSDVYARAKEQHAKRVETSETRNKERELLREEKRQRRQKQKEPAAEARGEELPFEENVFPEPTVATAVAAQAEPEPAPVSAPEPPQIVIERAVFPGEEAKELPSPEPAAAEAASPGQAQGEAPAAKENTETVTRDQREVAQAEVDTEIRRNTARPKRAYRFPRTDLLVAPAGTAGGDTNEQLQETAAKLRQTLHSFGVEAAITHISCGPTVTRYELQPEQGVKVSKIVNLADDIKLNLAAADIRIEAPIPGKAAIGIEVPNRQNSAVVLRELLETREFKKQESPLSFAVGKDIAGKPVITDIAKMPHLLIAGATGSGKSVCINTMIMSLLYKSSPEDVKLILIDPKVVELSIYNGIPHLFIPVVTDPKKAAGALNWAVSEMTDRYQKFAEMGARDLESYNARIEQLEYIDDEEEQQERPAKMPRIVIIVDELADLMMVAQSEVEDAICRLAQLARAAGMHLILATQRPSVDVITGLIKANMPSRIALSLASGVDSRTILDMNGAEKLLGHGDMLFYPQGYTKPARIQGAYVSDDEIQDVVQFLKENHEDHEYDQQIQEKIEKSAAGGGGGAGFDGGEEIDAYFVDAGRLIIEKDKASIGMLQRAFRIGFNRAARIMDQLADAGVVGEEEGTKPRRILMDMMQFENYLEEQM